MKKNTFLLAVVLFTLLLSNSVHAASCGGAAGGFGRWLSEFKQNAVKQGISPRTVSASLDGVTYNRKVIWLDRNQKSFKLSFDAFYRRRVDNAMIAKGKRKMKEFSQTFSRIEKRYGVPASVLTAIWALETNFGNYRGKMPIMSSLATLAYDCRRSKFFTNELISALKIVERGDMTPSRMLGAWAGEIGQTQFMASSYYRFAVDFDGNGHADLIRSVPDVLASTANYLKSYGWQKNGSWSPGTQNYRVLQQWNRAEVYSKTIAAMASRLSGS